MQEKETTSKYIHITSENRVIIESGLNCRLSCKEIGENIHKNATTVSREINKHVLIPRTGTRYRYFSNCVHRDACPISFACDNHRNCNSTTYNYINNVIFKDCLRLDEPKAVRPKKTYNPNKNTPSIVNSTIPMNSSLSTSNSKTEVCKYSKSLRRCQLQ